VYISFSLFAVRIEPVIDNIGSNMYMDSRQCCGSLMLIELRFILRDKTKQGDRACEVVYREYNKVLSLTNQNEALPSQCLQGCDLWVV